MCIRDRLYSARWWWHGRDHNRESVTAMEPRHPYPYYDTSKGAPGMGVSHSFNGSLTGERPLACHGFDANHRAELDILCLLANRRTLSPSRPAAGLWGARFSSSWRVAAPTTRRTDARMRSCLKTKSRASMSPASRVRRNGCWPARRALPARDPRVGCAVSLRETSRPQRQPPSCSE